MEEINKYLPHLLELRKRIFHSLIFFCIVCTPCIFFSKELYTFIALPVLNTLPSGGHLIATKVISPFTVPLKLAFFISLIISIPYFLYQIWSFIAPALYNNEKRLIYPTLFLSTFLLYTGMIFAHTLVLPMALHFFVNMAPAGVTVLTDIQYYLDFVLTLYLAFGFAFQVPIITFLVIRWGLVSAETLKAKRPMIIVGAFIVGMLLTPPDVVSQILLAVPLIGLFELGLLLARFYPKLNITLSSID